MVELTEFQKGAVLFAMDSEGCITISKNANSRVPHGFTYRAQITISNNSVPFLQSLQKMIGGKIYAKRKRIGEYQLLLRREEMNNGLLELFAKELIIKKDQAKLLLIYFQLPDRKGFVSDPEVRDAIFDMKNKLYEKIHMLNHPTKQVQAISKDIHLPSQKDG